MNRFALIFIHVACAGILLGAACIHAPNSKLRGTWKSKDGTSKLKISDKKFIMNDEEAEDYILKGDTISTSFEGNLPYTNFVIKKLDEHALKLIGPDSVAIEYLR